MFYIHSIALYWAVNAILVAGSTNGDKVHPLHGVHELLLVPDSSNPKLQRRTKVLQNSTSISKSWQNAILYQHNSNGAGNGPLDGDAAITCRSCYAMGTISTSLTYSDGFDATRGIEDVTNGVKPIATNLMQNAANFIESKFQGMGDAMVQDVQSVAAGSLGIEKLPYPTLPFDFNLDISPIQDITVRHQIDGMELFAQLDTSLSKGATYKLNLFKSSSRSTVKVSKDLVLDVTVAVDLIIDSQSAVNMSNGFHVRFGDGLLIKTKLFDNIPPHITFNGGQFEFLPVAINGDSAAMTATLQLSVHTGFTYQVTNMTVFGQNFGLNGGIESGMVANIAAFSTTVRSGDASCDLQATESYQFAAGAAAGANMRAGTQTWGPMPNTTMMIVSTTLDPVCASRTGTATSTPVSTSSDQAPQALVTTTISSITQILVGQACASSGLVNCPVSLQTTTTSPLALTIVTSLPSGVSATLPQTVLNSVVATSKFGTRARSFSPSSTESPASTENVIDGNTGGVSNKSIIGISVGLGVPFLLVLVAVAYMYFRARRHSARHSPSNSITSTQESLSRAGQKDSRTIFDYSSDPVPFGAYGGIHKASNVTVSIERNYGVP